MSPRLIAERARIFLVEKLPPLMRQGIGLAIATVAAIGASSVHMPLAWVLGPLLSMAAATIFGIHFAAAKNLRRLGQVGIGCTVGLSMTPVVVSSLMPLLPHVIVSAVMAVVLSAIFSVFMARYSGIDEKTSFFAVMPGGLSEMGTIGANMGARSEPIVLCQTLRVAFVVCLVPPLFGLFLATETTEITIRPELSAFAAVALLASGGAASYVLSLMRLNIPWTIGALVCVGILTATFAIDGDMPDLLFHAAQILIGYAIGSKVDILFLLKMPRITLVGAILIVANMIFTAVIALLLPVLSPLDYPASILATSPGGMAEMITTAHTFYLDVAAVTAFQVGRTLMVNAFSVHYWRFFNRIGLIGGLSRLLNRSS